MKEKTETKIILKFAVIAIISAALVKYGQSVVIPYFKNHIPIARETYLVDLTDNFTVTPEIGDIKHRFSFSEGQQARLRRVRSIVDVPQGTIHEFGLKAQGIFKKPSTWDIGSNSLFRKKDIEHYESDVWAVIDTLSMDTIEYKKTAFLEPLVAELLVLQEFKGDDRSLLIYSDLIENNARLSFLDKQTMRDVEVDAPYIWNSIPDVAKLDSLDGITVYFIHRPLSGDHEERYTIISRYLKKKLEGYNAKVVIQGKAVYTQK